MLSIASASFWEEKSHPRKAREIPSRRSEAKPCSLCDCKLATILLKAIGCEIKGSKSLDTFNCVQKYDWRIGGPLSAPMFAFKLAGNEANGIHLLPPFPPPIKGTNTGEEWAPLNPVQTESRKQKFD